MCGGGGIVEVLEGYGEARANQEGRARGQGNSVALGVNPQQGSSSWQQQRQQWRRVTQQQQQQQRWVTHKTRLRLLGVTMLTGALEWCRMDWASGGHENVSVCVGGGIVGVLEGYGEARANQEGRARGQGNRVAQEGGAAAVAAMEAGDAAAAAAAALGDALDPFKAAGGYDADRRIGVVLDGLGFRWVLGGGGCCVGLGRGRERLGQGNRAGRGQCTRAGQQQKQHWKQQRQQLVGSL